MALKHSLLFRPLSRPSSPAPVPAPIPIEPVSSRATATVERSARPLAKLSLSNFRRPSPAQSPAPNARTSPPLVYDGSYLESLSLRLSEAVSKALTQPAAIAGATDALGGKRPLPSGRGAELGKMIRAELDAAANNANLRRAVFRGLHKPLSVMLTTLSAHIMQLVASAAFLSPAVPTIQHPEPNPTQLHALAFSAFAGEVLQTFDELGLGIDLPGEIRGDGLKSIREGLTSLVGRTVTPLIAAVKQELLPLIEALEEWVPAKSSPPVPGAKPVHTKALSTHQSIATLQAVMPVYAKALTRYSTTTAAQASLAPLLISLVWRGLVALAHRVTPKLVGSSTPTSTPTSTPSVFKKGRALSSSTPPPTPPTSTRFTIMKLPPLPPSRPPSPSAAVKAMGSVAADARALHDLLIVLPRPDKKHTKTMLAREAVDDAFDALSGLVALLEHIQAQPPVGADGRLESDVQDLDVLTADLPMLVALHVLMAAYILPEPEMEQGHSRSISTMLGLGEAEYREGCLAGFGRAEQCAPAVGQRVLEELCNGRMDVSSGPATAVVARWLEEQLEDEAEADVDLL